LSTAKPLPPDPKFSGIRDVRQELRELKRQWERLEVFWERYFEAREGHAKRAYNPFTTAEDFESKLETTLWDLLEKRVARGWRADSGRAETAVVAVLAPICVEKFQQQTDAAAMLVAFNKAPSWDRRSIIEKGGWAIMPGTDKVNSAVISACAEKLGSAT
jgi:S-formylglutathione hydrolase FrmB